MSVVPGPASQDAVFKHVFASPALQCAPLYLNKCYSLTSCFMFYLRYHITKTPLEVFTIQSPPQNMNGLQEKIILEP
jgi:hypothetical protein